ncbi:MAG: homoserine O-succinyltransferase [Acidimicrobiales bacterium]
MTLRLVTPANIPRDDAADTVCAFINNMPDGAFDATERQFLGLLEEASPGRTIEVRRYTMAGVPRGEDVARRIASDYLPFADLYLDVPDLLIITGSNPIELNIEDEPYWVDLVDAITWARERVTTTLLSCLSAHAALRVFDGIERTRLAEKCTGVFTQHVTSNAALTEGLESDVLLPASRWNTVSSEAVRDAGYEIVIEADATGWTVATRDEDGRALVLVQGHPEYDPSSLLREYRRDAGRYVRGERDETPCLPFHCVAPEDWEGLERFHHEVVLDQRDPEVFETFPFDDLGARSPWPWRSMATRFFTNWVSSVTQEED